MYFTKAAKALLDNDYHFAKTMPKNPHWYTLKEEWDDKKLFEDVVQFIRDNGKVEYFWKKPYTKFSLNGYEYWTMGAAIEDTTLINKAKKKTVCIYDNVADGYYKLFDNESSRKEEDELFEECYGNEDNIHKIADRLIPLLNKKTSLYLIV